MGVSETGDDPALEDVGSSTDTNVLVTLINSTITFLCSYGASDGGRANCLG